MAREVGEIIADLVATKVQAAEARAQHQDAMKTAGNLNSVAFKLECQVQGLYDELDKTLNEVAKI